MSKGASMSSLLRVAARTEGEFVEIIQSIIDVRITLAPQSSSIK